MSPRPRKKLNRLFVRPLQLIGAIFVALLVVSFSLLGVASRRNLDRVGEVRLHVGLTGRLQQIGLQLEQALPAPHSGQPELDLGAVAEVRRAVAELRRLGPGLDPDTSGRLAQVEALLARGDSEPTAPAAALASIREILARKTSADLDLLHRIDDESRDEVRLAAVLLGVLIALGALALVVTRRRVLKPLDELRLLLSRLATGEHRPLPTEGVDPILLPVIANYNRLATSLAELEEARRSRTATLEREVRAATEALLEQQRSLARAERLAAVGEMSASVAHELRNPLAGIQMALANLRQEVPDPDRRQRLERVVAELDRIASLLDQLLARSHHVPEAAKTVDVGAVVDDLLGLVRYQVPPRIEIRSERPSGAEPSLRGRLPEGRFRQAVLNLVLNAAQALSDGAGTVTVAVERGGDDLVVRVTDDGPGFPPELLDGGIRPFVSGRPGGTGLGLPMVRRLARDLGGRLELANRCPHGAVATLRLPRGESHE